MSTLEMAWWMFGFPVLATWVLFSFGPTLGWPQFMQGTLVPHAEFDPTCTGFGGTGPCARCVKGPS